MRFFIYGGNPQQTDNQLININILKSISRKVEELKSYSGLSLRSVTQLSTEILNNSQPAISTSDNLTGRGQTVVFIDIKRAKKVRFEILKDPAVKTAEIAISPQ